ncbi:MAG: hypothetical protein ACI9ON_003081 [Limisphaerales bacterium]|jgi:hypothetical protein
MQIMVQTAALKSQYMALLFIQPNTKPASAEVASRIDLPFRTYIEPTKFSTRAAATQATGGITT